MISHSKKDHEEMNWLVSTDWLGEHLSDPEIVIIDCSWHLPDTGKFAYDDFLQAHIPGARFFDLNTASDPDSPYANMLPSAAHFAHKAGELGIGADSHVIVYDAGYVSARVWWMFRLFGHEKISILDGGLRKWRAEGRPLAAGPGPTPDRTSFPVRKAADRVVSLAEVRQAVVSGETTILDARTAAKFDGREPSGYPGVPGGYMPGAINTPWALFFDPNRNFAFITPEQAEAVFAQAGVDLSGPVITTCGSGVTAAILGFMIERNGKGDWRLYDGSWHEWGQHPDTPKLTR